jgi:hypothetical protein
MPRRIALLLALLVAVAGCNDATDGGGQAKSARDESVYDLRPGDCFDGGPQPRRDQDRIINVVAAVSCEGSHENEVFAAFDHPAPDDVVFPGEDEVKKVAQDGCVERFAGYLGHSYDDSELQVAVIAPGVESWSDNDRAIVCIVYGEKPLKGSQKADGD